MTVLGGVAAGHALADVLGGCLAEIAGRHARDLRGARDGPHRALATASI